MRFDWSFQFFARKMTNVRLLFIALKMMVKLTISTVSTTQSICLLTDILNKIVNIWTQAYTLQQTNRTQKQKQPKSRANWYIVHRPLNCHF